MTNDDPSEKTQNYTLCNRHVCSVSQSCLTLCNAMVYSSSGSYAHGISQARTLEWVAVSFSRGYFQPGIEPESPALAGGFFTTVKSCC